MNKKLAAKVLSRLPGFRNIGGYYIGTCNADVVSGYALDAPPGGIYIWRFIVPAYDRIDFLHMGLGTRIAQLSRGEIDFPSNDLGVLLKDDWQSFSNVRDCQSLLAYMEQEHCDGGYCQWVRYITYIRTGDLESASRMETQWRSSSGFPRVQSVAQHMKTVLEVKERSGWNGVQELFTEWSRRTVAKFCR